jgi:hypothetical protein
VDGVLLQQLGEAGQFARVPPTLNRTVLDYGQTSGVIPAVFQTLKSFEEYRRRIATADIADNSAHPILRIRPGMNSICRTCEGLSRPLLAGVPPQASLGEWAGSASPEGIR